MSLGFSCKKATGNNIFYLIYEEISRFGQLYTNCIVFASDCASSMLGCNSSVWSETKEAALLCLRLKCICHTLALRFQNAVSMLPSNMGFLLSKILY